MPRAYSLTTQLIDAHAGERVLCLAMSSMGRRFDLYAERPGASLNQRRHRMSDGSTRWLDRAGVLAHSLASPRADLPSGAAHVIAPVESASPLILVRISGALEQRAGYQEPCGGWIDGHDAVAERLCAALAEGDVLLVVDSPGGAAAGIQQAVARALEAKAANSRRVTVYADEMIGSAAMWWAMALGDEIFAPPMGQIGSIGARGGHKSIAGALAKDGVVVTYFADPPDKVALAPEMPLTPEGERRGMRDITMIAGMFRDACCAGPLGQRAGLTPEFLIELGADMLTGQAAVDAGLCDGIDTLENVTAYALTLAESEPGNAAKTTGATGAPARKDRAMSLNTRVEGDEPEAEDGEAKGTKPDGICKSCGTGNPVAHKFCAQCGESMAALPMDDGDEDDDAPPSSKPAAKVAARAPAVAPMPQTSSIAAIVRAEGESPLQIKTAAIKMRHDFDRVMATVSGVFGVSTVSEGIGAMLAVPHKLADASAAIDREAKAAKAAEKDKRWALAHRLNRLGLAGRERASIFEDKIENVMVNGVETPKRTAVALMPEYTTMDLATFDSLVSRLEKGAPVRRATPFEADRDAAKDASDATAADHGAGTATGLGSDGKPTKAAIERAKRSPVVLKMYNAPGNVHTLDLLAEQAIISAAQNGVSLGGIQ